MQKNTVVSTVFFFNATCIFDKSFGLRRSGHKEVKKPVIDQVISVYGKNEIRKMFSDAVKHGGLLFADKNRVQKLKSLFLTVQFDEKALFNSELIDQSIQHFTGIINSKSILNEYNKTSKNRQITKDVMSQAYFKTERNLFDFRTDFKRNRLHLLQKKVECRAYQNLHLLDKEQYKKADAAIKVATDIMHDMLQQSTRLRHKRVPNLSGYRTGRTHYKRGYNP